MKEGIIQFQSRKVNFRPNESREVDEAFDQHVTEIDAGMRIDEERRLFDSQLVNIPLPPVLRQDPPPTYNEAVSAPGYSEKVYINTDDPPSYSELRLT